MAPLPPPSFSPAPLLVLDHVRLERAGRCLVEDLSLQLAPGEALCLTGPNGSGKSSLLRLMAGFCPPASGTLTRRGTIGWLGPEDALKPTLTVEQNLRLAGPCTLDSLLHALHRVDLAPLLGCPVRLLSLGQRRRVALARLLLTGAPLWLLDEPANALDAASLTLLAGLLAAHRARGGVLVIASHTPLTLPASRTLSLGSSAAPPRASIPPPHMTLPGGMAAESRAGPGTHHATPSPFRAHLRREALLGWYSPGENLAGLLFLMVCGVLFPLALGPSPALLQQAGPGIIWVCALLASLLPLERLYNADAEDGSLDLQRLALSPALLALGKILFHWLSSSVPILLAIPLFALLFQLPAHSLPVLLLSLTLGSLTLALTGGMTAAIALGARRNSLLLPLLTLPLMTPSLIFGTLACSAPAGPALRANLSLQGALLLLALPLCPLLAGASLKEAGR